MTGARGPDADDGSLRFRFDGRDFRAHEGETLAAALLRAGVRTLTRTTEGASARGAYCWMGWCQECRVSYRGRWFEACRLVVEDGMEAEARQVPDAR